MADAASSRFSLPKNFGVYFGRELRLHHSANLHLCMWILMMLLLPTTTVQSLHATNWYLYHYLKIGRNLYGKQQILQILWKSMPERPNSDGKLSQREIKKWEYNMKNREKPERKWRERKLKGERKKREAKIWNIMCNFISRRAMRRCWCGLQPVVKTRLVHEALRGYSKGI